jgi:gluconolactonase
MSAIVDDISALVDPEATFEWLGSGYGGHSSDGLLRGVAEGPIWVEEENCLIFSDNANAKRYRWTADSGITLISDTTNDANGLARDPSGRIVACEHATRRVTRLEHDGSITVVANNYRGLRLNRPNDIVVSTDGAIYFTDPITLGVASELDLAGVYRVSPDLGQINLLVRDFVLPNGLAFSPDESILYVNDSMRRHIRAFNVEREYGTGLLDLSSDHVLTELTAPGAGVPDGMKVDEHGNVWCTGPGGIWVVSPTGEQIGRLETPEGKHITNFCFGGEDGRTLFVTTLTEMGRINVRVRGNPTPPASGNTA